MLRYRVTRYIQHIASVFKNIAANLNDNSPRGQATYVFIKLDFILSELQRSRAIEVKDAEMLEQEIEQQVEVIVKEIMLQYYGNMIGFVSKGDSADTNPDA